MLKIPKLADTNFVVGFVLPTAVALLAVALVWPGARTAFPPLAVLTGSDLTTRNAVMLVLAVWALGVVLTTTNQYQYQVLEGYFPPLSRLGWLRRRQLAAYDALLEEHDALRDRLAAAPVPDPGDQRRWSDLRQRLVRDFPWGHRDHVLPTRFGNRLRAFEAYPLTVYGADGVTVWPRLVSVIPPDCMRSVDEPRAQVDCFVNAVFLALLVGLGAAAEAAAALAARDPPRALWWGCVVMVCAAAAFGSYAWATVRVVAWGEAVRAAFDCFLPSLAAQLGHRLPEDPAERRAFWEEFTTQAIFEEPMRRAWPTRAPPPPAPPSPAAARDGGGAPDGAEDD